MSGSPPRYEVRTGELHRVRIPSGTTSLVVGSIASASSLAPGPELANTAPSAIRPGPAGDVVDVPVTYVGKRVAPSVPAASRSPSTEARELTKSALIYAESAPAGPAPT